MSKGVIEVVAGAAEIASGIALDLTGVGGILGNFLISSGIGMTLGGIGTLLTKQQQGLSANVLNSIAPWNVVYGQAKVGGTVVFIEETGESDKYLHKVYVLACHPCNSIDAVLFDGKRVILSNATPTILDSSSPTQWTSNISSIVRSNGLVTVTLSTAGAFTGLFPGDTIAITNVTTDMTLNGEYQVNPIGTAGTQFEYTCGGSDVSITGQGTAKTTWPDYGDTIHAEIALGTQTSNPFPGLVASGDSGSQGLWTSAHALQGRTAIYLRLKYGGNTYASGLPTISFLVSGKNDIYDPRTGTTGYTTNSALCIADFLCQQTWGFKCGYGADVPIAAVATAANICDEAVTLASGQAEPRYTCNGSFQLNAKRGEILRNLLTSCAGRLTYSGGQFVVNPGAWTGTTIISGGGIPTNSSGSPVASATLNVVASWTAGSAGIGTPAIDGVYGPVKMGAVDYSADQFSLNLTGITGTAATFSTAIGTGDLSRLSQLSVVAYIVGTLYGSDTTPVSTLDIYDCTLSVTYQDASTGTIRPAKTFTQTGVGGGIFYAGTSGQVANPANAIDTDSTSYASVTRSTYDGFALCGYLQMWNMDFPLYSAAVPVTAVTFPNYLAGPFQWKPKLAIRDLYNGVKATYVSPLNSWQASDMPPYAQDTDHGYSAPAGITGYYDVNMAADGGDRRWYDMQLPFTISVSMAQRIAKIELMRRRQQGQGTFVFNLAMYQVMPLDILEITLPFLGWTNKLLEVSTHRFVVNKKEDGIALGTELDLQETDSSIYNWSTAEELTLEGYQQAQTSNIGTVPSPSGVTLANSPVNNGGGISTNQVSVTWTAPTDGYVVNGGQTIAQYSLDGTNWIGLGTYDSSVTTAMIPNVAAGQSYYTRIAYVNAAGIQGAWTVEGPFTASGSALRRIDDETPAGTQNGTNPTFTLAQTPNPALSLQLLLNGELLTQTLDYTLSGNAITMISYLPNATNGDVLRAYYWY